MNDSQNIQRDTPLRRFTTFVWGIALFGVFGIASLIAYWSIDNSQNAYALAAEERGKVTKEVEEAQAALIAAKTADPKIIPALNQKPKRTKNFVPGTPSHEKANAVPVPVEGASLDGQKVFLSKGCIACHGVDGKTSIDPRYPILAGVGKDAAYLSKKMQDIKSGEYATELTPLMQGFIAACSDEEIEAMSEWLATSK